MHKVSYTGHPWGRGKFLKSFGYEYHARCEEGKGISWMDVWKNITRKKGKGGSFIILLIMLRLLGRISSEEKGKEP